MTDLFEAGLAVDGSWPWLLLLPPLVWLARSVYGRTRPGVRPATERLLWLLRAAGLGLLILLLTEPLVTYLARHALRPQMVALLDTSPSMAVEEAGQTRFDRARKALAGELGLHLSEAPMFGFSRVPYAIARDTLTQIVIGGHATDLAAALTKATDATGDSRRMAGVVLLSDGGHNLGEDPVAVAARLEVPVIALGVGSEEPPADIQILSAGPDAPALAGKPLDLRVTLRNWGYPQAVVELAVEEEEQTLSRTHVQLGAEGRVQSVGVKLSPLDPGPHILRVTAGSMEGELSSQNNQSLVFLRVHQSRPKVLLVAGGPGPDVAFLRRTLREDSTLAVTDLVGRDSSTFYGGDSFPPPGGLARFDAVVLIDPGQDLIDANAAEQIDSFLRAGGGLLFVGGSRTLSSWDPGSPIARLLPIRTDPPNPLVVSTGALAIAQASAGHSLSRSLASRLASAVQDPWRRLPPLAGHLSGVRPEAGATALLESAGEPVLVAGVVGNGRVVAATGTGFWRLDLLAAGVGEDPQRVRSLWRDTIRWLAVAAPTGSVRSSPAQPVYRAGEDATVAAEVYDELREPIQAADVTIQLQPPGSRTAMESMGAGRYQATWSGLAPGEYTYRVEADDSGQRLGRSEGRFVIESHSVEASDPRANPQMLADIARSSGGDYRPLSRWRDLSDLLRPPTRLVREAHRVGIEVSQPLWLGMIVVLLSVEWLIRRRSGML